MGTIRADFNTHRDNRRDALILLPVLRKLLLEIFQEIGRVGVDTPCRTPPQGDVLHMRVSALHPDIRWVDGPAKNSGVPAPRRRKGQICFQPWRMSQLLADTADASGSLTGSPADVV
jgi:hypothetical protein